MPPDGLTALVALVMLVELGGVVIDELPAAGEDALLLGVDVLDLVDDRSDDVALCVNSIEIPLLPSTDPVWTLTIGLQGCEVVLAGAGA